jgi:hypothetical protein
MSSPPLERITLQLPVTHPEFHRPFLSLLAPLGSVAADSLTLTVSDEKYFPRLSIAFRAANESASAEFHLPGAEQSVNIENITGAEKKNPLPYRHLSIDEAARRITTAGWKILSSDHLGINLPWFGPGVHPRIMELRKSLATACLYHQYPSGEPWDFILPGDKQEIASLKSIDYSATRRPKFELVSFDIASTPLIQINLSLDERFENFTRLFPEALADPTFRNIWIYLENPYRIDICLVLNACPGVDLAGENSAGDWCRYFEGCRL